MTLMNGIKMMKLSNNIKRYGDEWLKKLNNTYEAMLSKLPCCDD